MGAPLTIPRRALTVEQFQKMAEVGILKDDDRVELIEGELIEMAPIGPALAYRVHETCELLRRLVGDRAIVWSQNPIALPTKNQPQPDIALLAPPSAKYRSALPTAADVLLIIEVADSSLAYDRDVKTKIYAAHGIPEMWIQDVQSATLWVYRDPIGDSYSRIISLQKSDSVSLAKLAEAPISVGDLWV
jgi:Uma2 family endonuclease